MKIIEAATAPHPAARNNADKIDQAARQLEQQFAQLLIKSMRDASFGDALFPEENQLFHEMYDQQLAKALTAGKGLGIAAMVARQLANAHTPAPVLTPGVSRPLHSYQSASETQSPENFVSQIWHHAQKAAHELGVNVRALIAQAALETGWGKHRIKGEGGKEAHNLFGIKATGWKGERANTRTHEYRNGERKRENADFRAYSSVAESFADYVKLLKHNPRYQTALNSGDNVHGFANALQQAGYASDPSYAEKISTIANGPVLKEIMAKMKTALHHP